MPGKGSWSICAWGLARNLRASSAPHSGRARRGSMPLRELRGGRLFCLFEVFHDKQVSVTLNDSNAHGIHVSVENVGPVRGRIHELGVGAEWVGRLNHVLRQPDETCARLSARPGSDGSPGKMCATECC